MAWVYEQKFNGLNNGDLAGQDSFTLTAGLTTIDVTESNPFEGTKCITKTAGAGCGYIRSITAVASGVFYYSARAKTGSASATASVRIRLTSSGTRALQVDLDLKTNNITCQDGAVNTQDTGQDYVNDTYIRIGVDFDCTTDTYELNFDNGAWSASYDFQNAVASIDKLEIKGENINDNAWYMDYISPNYVDPGGSNIKKLNSIAYANLKKVNNIAIANIKKINTIS